MACYGINKRLFCKFLCCLYMLQQTCRYSCLPSHCNVAFISEQQALLAIYTCDVLISFVLFSLPGGSNRRPVKSLVVGRPILLALQDIDGSPSFLEKALTFIERYGMLLLCKKSKEFNFIMRDSVILSQVS